jgi:hypothetical protein
MSGSPATPVPSPEDLAYIEKVRLATERVSEGGQDELRPAVEELKGARFDFGLPAGSHRKEVELLKAVLNKVLSRYARHLTSQLESFAAKLARVAEVLASRAERLQATGDELLARVSAIEERLSRLEKEPPPLRLPRPPRSPGARKGHAGGASAQ